MQQEKDSHGAKCHRLLWHLYSLMLFSQEENHWLGRKCGWGPRVLWILLPPLWHGDSLVWLVWATLTHSCWICLIQCFWPTGWGLTTWRYQAPPLLCPRDKTSQNLTFLHCAKVAWDLDANGSLAKLYHLPWSVQWTAGEKIHFREKTVVSYKRTAKNKNALHFHATFLRSLAIMISLTPLIIKELKDFASRVIPAWLKDAFPSTGNHHRVSGNNKPIENKQKGKRDKFNKNLILCYIWN